MKSMAFEKKIDYKARKITVNKPIEIKNTILYKNTRLTSTRLSPELHHYQTTSLFCHESVSFAISVTMNPTVMQKIPKTHKKTQRNTHPAVYLFRR
jgi:hypothetical protein